MAERSIARVAIEVVLGIVLVIGISACSADGPQSTMTVSADQGVRASIESLPIEKFMSDHPGHWVERETEAGMESVTITNYDPQKKPIPQYQETISWGYVGSQPESNTEVIISIWVRDEDNFYVVELTPGSLEERFTEGNWFPKQDRNEYIRQQMALLNDLMGW
jgi:lipoprotein